MNEFGILNTRKRAVVALIHSVIFLGVAVHGLLSPKAGIFHGPAVAGDIVLMAIYLIVASILGWLVGMSRCAKERFYFLLCVGSATFGLLRTVFGDPAIPAAQYIRVLLLSSAIAVGASILRSFSRLIVDDAVPE